MRGFWDAAKVGTVNTNRHQDGCCEEKCWHYGPGICVVLPICSIEGIRPGDRLPSVIVVPFGFCGPWPSHCVVLLADVGMFDLA